MSAKILSVLLLSLLLLGTAFGQIKSGVISGVTSDSSGAVVSGASVTLVNQDTNITTTVTSDSSGVFSFPYLAPGKYTIKVEVPNFSRYVQTDINIATAQTVDVPVKLETGGLQETVTVTSDAAALQTTNATVQSSVNARSIETLPNITHNPFAYTALQPGVVPRGAFNNTQSTQSFGVGIDGRRQASAIGINGGVAFSNDILLDGVSIQGSAWNETAVLPNQDALQEVRVITNNYSAEYGRAQGIVLFTTKSGTNDFHGGAFYRIRNEAFNANSFENNANGIRRPAFKSNTFGGTVGGPIWRNKAFFFASYEGLRFKRAYNFLLTVPTAAERSGDFSNTFVGTLTNPLRVKIYDPFNATLVGNRYERALLASRIPTNRLDSFGLTILNAYPLPNRTPDDIFNRNNYFYSAPQKITKNNVNSRVDYQLGKHSLYGTYGFQRGNIATPRSWGETNPFSGNQEFVGNQQPDNNYYFAIGDTVVLSSNLVLDVRFGLNRIKSNNERDRFEDFDYNKYGVPAAIQAINAIPGAPPSFSPLGSVTALNTGTSVHKREKQLNSDFNASITWIRGNWTHKFGGVFRNLYSDYIDVDDSSQIQTNETYTRLNINADGSTNGLVTSDASFNGLAMASFALGAGVTRTSPGFAINLKLTQQYYGLYSQNDWRVNNKLSLNLGLRWDVQPGPTEKENRFSSIDLDGTEPLFGTRGAIVFPGVTTGNRHLWKTDYKNFGPRLGAAYQLTDSIVLRGGYGLNYIPSNTGFNDGPGFYAAGAFTAAAPSNLPGSSYGTNPTGVVVAPFYSSIINPVIAPVGPNVNDPRVYGGARRFPINFKNGYVQQWNAFYEQKFGANWIASAGYIGSHGNNLIIAFVPINSAQLVDQTLLDSWRNTYISTNGTTNPSTQQIQNPWQPATGPLISYGSGNIRNRTISRLEAAFPYPLEGDNIHLSNGKSDYHAMQLSVTRQYAQGLQLNASYTWSKLIAFGRYNAQTNQGYADGGATNYFANIRPDLQKTNRQITTNDVPHRVALNWVYDLPLGQGKMFATGSSILDTIVGGWRLGGSYIIQSGFVGTISNGGTNTINNLPDRVSGVDLELPKNLQRWYDGKTNVTLPSGRIITPCNGCFLKYNIDAFSGRTVTGPNGRAIADLFWYGTSAPAFDEMRTPTNWNVNMSLDRKISFGERYSLSLSAQATNVFNHTQFRPALSTGFGGTVIQQTLDTPANQGQGLKIGNLLDTANTFGSYTRSVYDGRQIEFVVKFNF